jgi:hypothetical protein
MYLTAAPLHGMRDRPLRHICWSMWFAELDEHFELHYEVVFEIVPHMVDLSSDSLTRVSPAPQYTKDVNCISHVTLLYLLTHLGCVYNRST